MCINLCACCFIYEAMNFSVVFEGVIVKSWLMALVSHCFLHFTCENYLCTQDCHVYTIYLVFTDSVLSVPVASI